VVIESGETGIEIGVETEKEKGIATAGKETEGIEATEISAVGETDSIVTVSATVSVIVVSIGTVAMRGVGVKAIVEGDSACIVSSYHIIVSSPFTYYEQTQTKARRWLA
jgi:hypothetical protein